jgi:hypothetical protein
MRFDFNQKDGRRHKVNVALTIPHEIDLADFVMRPSKHLSQQQQQHYGAPNEHVISSPIASSSTSLPSSSICHQSRSSPSTCSVPISNCTSMLASSSRHKRDTKCSQPVEVSSSPSLSSISGEASLNKLAPVVSSEPMPAIDMVSSLSSLSSSSSSVASEKKEHGIASIMVNGTMAMPATPTSPSLATSSLSSSGGGVAIPSRLSNESLSTSLHELLPACDEMVTYLLQSAPHDMLLRSIDILSHNDIRNAGPANPLDDRPPIPDNPRPYVSHYIHV